MYESVYWYYMCSCQLTCDFFVAVIPVSVVIAPINIFTMHQSLCRRDLVAVMMQNV